MRENVNEMVSRATFSTYARLRITGTNFSRHVSSIHIVNIVTKSCSKMIISPVIKSLPKRCNADMKEKLTC